MRLKPFCAYILPICFLCNRFQDKANRLHENIAKSNIFPKFLTALGIHRIVSKTTSKFLSHIFRFELTLCQNTVRNIDFNIFGSKVQIFLSSLSNTATTSDGMSDGWSASVHATNHISKIRTTFITILIN